MPVVTEADALGLLRVAMGGDTGQPEVQFRDGQWEAIDQIVNQRGKVLCVQRTGWGKSIVYLCRPSSCGRRVRVSRSSFRLCWR